MTQRNIFEVLKTFRISIHAHTVFLKYTFINISYVAERSTVTSFMGDPKVKSGFIQPLVLLDVEPLIVMLNNVELT